MLKVRLVQSMLVLPGTVTAFTLLELLEEPCLGVMVELLRDGLVVIIGWLFGAMLNALLR